jgi:metal-responsive CopG/Arc/MetJ family transcriptional regulator
MQTVQMTLDTKLVNDVDRAAKRLGLSRSAFAPRALAAALERLRIEDHERRQAEGYTRKPVRRGEFDAWTTEQVWPE